MRKLLTAASLLACLSTSACGDNFAFRHATYLGYPYEYDETTGLAVLDHNKPRGHFVSGITSTMPVMQSRDDVAEPKPVRHAPVLLFADPFRGRNWR